MTIMLLCCYTDSKISSCSIQCHLAIFYYLVLAEISDIQLTGMDITYIST